MAGIVQLASQATMESASSTGTAVTPGTAQYHPGVAKAWHFLQAGGGVVASYNFSSLTTNATGDYTFNLARAFSSSNYAAVATAGLQGRQANVVDRNPSVIRVQTTDQSFALELTNTSLVCFGDQ